MWRPGPAVAARQAWRRQFPLSRIPAFLRRGAGVVRALAERATRGAPERRQAGGAWHDACNSHVSRGQVIARIEPDLFEAAFEQARANLAAAEGNVVRARARADDAASQAARDEELAREQVLAFAERDTAVASAAARHDRKCELRVRRA